VEPNPHHFGGVGAVARCGSSSDISKRDVHDELFFYSYFLVQQFSLHRIRRKKNVRPFVNFITLKNVGLLYSRVGAGAAVAASKFSFHLEREPEKNDVAPQHCFYQNRLFWNYTFFVF
jgi:hypothetical protein